MLVLKGRKLNGRAWLVNATLPATPSGGTGAVGNTTATLNSGTAFDQRRVFNRDVYVGDPAGFSTHYNKGWGAVPVVVTPSKAVSTGLWMRLHDAMDAAALQSVPGSGAVIQPVIAVPGVTTLAATASTVILTVPAGLAWYYVDLALDPAMTNPLRVPIVFGVGAVFGFGPGTSHGAGFTSDWAYAGQGVPPIEQMVTISNYGVVYSPFLYSGATPVTNTWQKPGNFGNSPYDTSFAAEFLRLSCQQLGVNCALVGYARTGGTSWEWQAPYDTRVDHPYGALVNTLGHAGNKWEVQLVLNGNDSGVNMGMGNSYRNRKLVLDSLQAINANPNMGVVTAYSPLFDGNLASDDWRPFHRLNRDLELNRPNTVNNDWYDCGGYNVGGHTTMLSRMRMARQYYRYAMGLMGPPKGGFAMRRGPSITGGTRSGTTITLHVTHDGGTALKKISWSEGDASTAIAYTEIDTSNLPDSALGWMFTVYAAGEGGFSTTTTGGGKTSLKYPLAATSVKIVDANTIKLFLATDPGAGTALDVYHAMDFAVGGSNGLVILTDDTSDADGLDYGRPLRRTIDPVYIPAPAPATQQIQLAQPLDPVAGAWLHVKGSGTGASLDNSGTALFASSIELSVNGGPYVVPDGLIVRNDNTWSGLLQIPSSIAPGTSLTIAARRVGQGAPDATRVVTVTTGRNELPDPDGTGAIRAAAVASWDAMNRGTMWQETGKQTPAAHLQPVRLWQDALGDATNDLSTPKPDPLSAPFFDIRKRSWTSNRSDTTIEMPYVLFGGVTPPDGKPQFLYTMAANAAQQMIGDCTFLFVVDSENASWFMLGQTPPSGPWNFQPAFKGTGTPAFSRVTGATVNASITGSYINQQIDYVVARYADATKTLTLQNRNGTASVSNTSMTPVTAMNAIWLGASFEGYGGGGRFHQIVLFNRRLTDTEVTALTAWAQTKWPY